MACINFVLVLMLKTCDLLFYSMVYLGCCFVRYSSGKECYSFSNHDLGEFILLKINCNDIMTPHVMKIPTRAKDRIFSYKPSTKAVWSCFELYQALRSR